MTKPETILQAGKQIAAIASGGAFINEPLKAEPENILGDPSQARRGQQTTKPVSDSASEPGNPNDVDHDDQDPGQEKA